MGARRTGFGYVITLIAALTGLLVGYDAGLASQAVEFVHLNFNLTPHATTLVAAAVVLGAVLAAALGGVLSAQLGRRGSILLAVSLFCLGAIVAAFARIVVLVVIGRLAVGFGIGLISFAGPMYIAEVAPFDRRGAMVSVSQLAVTLGLVASQLVDYALGPDGDWRGMFGLTVVPAVLLLIGMLQMPLSPRWLLTRGHPDTARANLAKIRGTNDVDAELAEMGAALAAQRGVGLRDLASPAVRAALVVGVGLAVLQQMAGVGIVIYNARAIFDTPHPSLWATAGVGCVDAAFTLVAIVLVDWVGRRPLLLASLAGMVLGLVVLAASAQRAGAGAPGLGHIIGLVVYVASFAVGIGPIFWLLIAEIYPLGVRGVAMSLAALANWGTSFVVALAFPPLVKSLGMPGTFGLFAGAGILAWFFCYFLVPETKNRTLEQIELDLRAKAGGYDSPAPVERRALPARQPTSH
jgi:sugar porter (SP) family MFS transporter